MTRKDYMKFADLFGGELACHKYSPQNVQLEIRAIILSTADIFRHDNIRFNREKFYLACGLTKNGGLNL